MPGLTDSQKMLAYYISGIGGNLGGEGSVAQALSGITQQQIQTENFQKLLKTLLAGGSKVSMDKEGLNIKAPAAAFRDTEYTIPGFEESYAGVSNVGIPDKGSRLDTDLIARNSIYNPSASPLDVSSAGLIGLTPEMISQALQLKFAGEELERKKLADITEAGYYGAAARKMDAQTAALLTPEPSFIEGLTLDQFKALATSDKEYLVAKERARKLGDTEFMSKEEWQMMEPTDRMRFLEGLLRRPELMEVEKELKKASVAPSELTPVNWTTATKELTKRFGKLDSTGMWAVTPDLQATHRKAQDILVSLKDEGVKPLRAINQAETKAREWKDTIERNYFNRIKEAEGVRDKSGRNRLIEWVKSEFYRQFKYIPTAANIGD